MMLLPPVWRPSGTVVSIFFAFNFFQDTRCQSQPRMTPAPPKRQAAEAAYTLNIGDLTIFQPNTVDPDVAHTIGNEC